MSASAIYWTNQSRFASYDNVPGWSTVETTSHSSSDVHYIYTTQLPWGIYGLYSCSELYSNGTCDHGHVRYSANRWSGLSGSQRQSLACHETGHSVGLLHPFDDGQADDPDIFQCMVPSTWPAYLGSHNVWHLTSEPYYN